MTLASDYFDAYLRWLPLRSRIDELLVAIYPGHDFSDDDIRLDYYDESIEIWGVKPTAEAYDKLREAGFVGIWQHPHPRGRPHHTACGCQSTRPVAQVMP